MNSRNKYFYLLFIILMIVSTAGFHSNLISQTQNTNQTKSNNSNKANNINTPITNIQSKLATQTLVTGGANFSTATQLTLGTINGTFNQSSSYSDYFKVNLNVSSQIQFSLIINSSISMNIYNSSENLLSTNANQTIEQIQIQTLYTGTYYIVLTRPNLQLNSNFTLYITDLNYSLPGYSFNSAINASFQNYQGNFSIIYPSLYYKIYVPANEDLVVNITGTYSHLLIYNSTHYLFTNDTDSLNQIHLSIVNTDYYYLELDHSIANWGQYDLMFFNYTTDGTFFSDGGNSFTNATLIHTGMTQNNLGTLVYYKIKVNTSETFSLNVLSLNYQTSDNYILIYYPNETLFNTNQIFQSTTITFSPLTNGTYYIELSFNISMSFQLDITFLSNSNDIGKSFNTAVVITNGTYSGNLNYNPDSFYYKILVNDSYLLSISSNTGNLNLFLYNSSFNIIAKGYSPSPIRISILQSGYYYIKVQNQLISQLSTYTLNVSITLLNSTLYLNGGDSFTSAVSIQPSTIEAFFNTNPYTNYFKIYLNKTNAISITLNNTYLTNYQNNMYIFYANQSSIVNMTFVQSVSASITATVSGFYYIEINSSIYNGNYPYILKIKEIGNDTYYGSNFSNAIEITNGSYTGITTTNQNSDYYKMFLNNGTDLILNTNSSSLFVYNSSKYLLGQNIYSNNSNFYYSILITGFYFIKINDSIFYSFNIAIQQTNTTIYTNAGNSFTNATLISIGNYQIDLSLKERSDYFKILSNVSAYILVNLTLPATFLTSLVIYNSNKVIIDSVNSNSGKLYLIFNAQLGDYYYFEIYKAFNLFNYVFNTIIISNSTTGGISFTNAVEINNGNYAGYALSGGSERYFKIYLTAGNDIFINFKGDLLNYYAYYNYFALYNSLQNRLDVNTGYYQLNWTVLYSGYYYLGLYGFSFSSSSNQNFMVFNLSINIQPSGSIFYQKGGDSFASSPLIHFGMTENHMVPYEVAEFFKINLNATQFLIFYFPKERYYVNFFFYCLSIFDSNQHYLNGECDNGNPFNITLEVPNSGIFYIKITSNPGQENPIYNYGAYSFDIIKTLIPKSPTNIQVTYNNNNNNITVTWTDSPNIVSYYLVYMSNSQFNSQMIQPNYTNLSLITVTIGKVSQGVEKLVVSNKWKGNFYFAVVGVNSMGAKSFIQAGYSSTTKATYLDLISSTTQSTYSAPPSSYSSSPHSSSNPSVTNTFSSKPGNPVILFFLLIILFSSLFLGFLLNKRIDENRNQPSDQIRHNKRSKMKTNRSSNRDNNRQNNFNNVNLRNNIGNISQGTTQDYLMNMLTNLHDSFNQEQRLKAEHPELAESIDSPEAIREKQREALEDNLYIMQNPKIFPPPLLVDRMMKQPMVDTDRGQLELQFVEIGQELKNMNIDHLSGEKVDEFNVRIITLLNKIITKDFFKTIPETDPHMLKSRNKRIVEQVLRKSMIDTATFPKLQQMSKGDQLDALFGPSGTNEGGLVTLEDPNAKDLFRSYFKDNPIQAVGKQFEPFGPFAWRYGIFRAMSQLKAFESLTVGAQGNYVKIFQGKEYSKPENFKKKSNLLHLIEEHGPILVALFPELHGKGETIMGYFVDLAVRTVKMEAIKEEYLLFESYNIFKP